jgi:hypothetical protein
MFLGHTPIAPTMVSRLLAAAEAAARAIPPPSRWMRPWRSIPS